MTGEEIRHIRERLGLNQVEFAQLNGVHPITVSKWERDRATPSPFNHALLLGLSCSRANKFSTPGLVRNHLACRGVAPTLAILLIHLT